jgi:hypothetical protein
MHDTDWSDAMAHPLVVKLFQELDDDRKRIFHDIVAPRIKERKERATRIRPGTFMTIACRTDWLVDAVLSWGKYHDYEN